ncbi:MAG: NAD(P)/FAD-dependent oxidoreductase [Lachnospiraceae bacterium]|nr:NAD(P)/FAD-dependent oxidoreductase [Lachnospiraceae bacterium]
MMKVLIVGGGAAGMMAAVRAGELFSDVTIIEKNEKLGKKIYITGKGRCNVTNNADIEVIFKNINRNPKFMYSALYGFDNSRVYSFFEENGCPLKVERGERVFPVSDHASDIIKTLTKALKDRHVKIMLNTAVKELILEDGAVKGVVLDDGSSLYADKVIVTTGGVSYPTTGSTGDGYKFAESAGHTVTPVRPGLVPLVTGETWVPRLQGLSLKNVELKLFSENKCVYKEQGEMLFTHFGISGPLVLSSSAYYDKESRKNKNITVSLDLKPALDEEALDKRILRDFEKFSNKQFKNSLDELLPAKLIPVIVDLSGIDPYKAVNVVSREERKNLVHLLKNLEMTVIGTGNFNEAIITIGGVNVKEINASTMESKLVKNLFFAGEVLDIDAMTGGFNLQIAWSTGYLAGECAET